MSGKHLYKVLIGDDYFSKWVRVWANSKEDVFNVCAEKYPSKYVEQVEYIK